jgi:hypothetical protein
MATTPNPICPGTLATPVEVVHHLASIAKSGHMVTVFSNKGKTFILTRFLEVDAKRGVLLLDWGADPVTNDQLLASERNVFVCSPEGENPVCHHGGPQGDAG